MKLFKLILFFFAIYFIRRLIQAYHAVKVREEVLRQKEEALKEEATPAAEKVVEAEYKVID